jgi:hypothetical protein
VRASGSQRVCWRTYDRRSELAVWPLFGVNPALARKVTGLSTGPAWVTPGTGFVCIIGVGGTCGPNGAALSGHLLVYGNDRNVETVFGLVPNGVNSVSVVLTNGSSETAPVVDNL